MNRILKLMVPCLVLASLACGESGPGPEGDAGKTPAEVKTEIKDQDTAVLEAAVTKYEAAIAEVKGEAKKLKAEIEEVGGQMLDDLLGEGKADEAAGDVEKQVSDLEGDLKTLKAKVEDLVAKLKAYTSELASRG